MIMGRKCSLKEKRYYVTYSTSQPFDKTRLTTAIRNAGGKRVYAADRSWSVDRDLGENAITFGATCSTLPKIKRAVDRALGEPVTIRKKNW